MPAEHICGMKVELFSIPLTPREGARELYFRGEGVRPEGGGLVGEKGAVVSFDTFFGAISVEKIKKYTSISSLEFNFDIIGEFLAEIRTEESLVASATLSESGSITVSLSDIPSGAKLIYPVLRANESGGELIDLNVSAAYTPCFATKCALITCTYKREEQVKRNIAYLSYKTDCDIIVVDNGKPLSQSDFPADVMLIPNSNTGGSGGYKRGMEAALQLGGITHFLLIDDDVEVDYAAVQRALSFASCLKTEYQDLSVAGSMLYMDKPMYQFEAGGHFYPDGSQRGFGHFLDLADTKNLLLNEQENAINYGGWWFMLMPSKYAAKGNFPLPFFMKYDDVEYALRCKQRIITLNGVGIWHEKFEAKYNSTAEYYNVRNYLHLCEMYAENFTRKKALKFAKKRIKAKLRRRQYKMAEAARRGYEDYLKGLDYLQNLNAEQNHKELCKLNYEYISYDEIERRYGVRPADNTFYPPWRIKIAVDPTTRKKYVFTDKFYDKPWQYLFTKYAVHCDSDNNCGYVTYKNRTK